MNKYELMFIANPLLEEAERDELLQQIKKEISKSGNFVSENPAWVGEKKRLAYPITKAGKTFQDGVYYVWKIELDPNKVKDLTNYFKFNNNVVRSQVLSESEI